MTAALWCWLAVAAGPADDWRARESAHLRNIRQVTQGFVRAGEGYFAPRPPTFCRRSAPTARN